MTISTRRRKITKIRWGGGGVWTIGFYGEGEGGGSTDNYGMTCTNFTTKRVEQRGTKCAANFQNGFNTV